MSDERHLKHAELIDRTNSVGVEFLRTDIEAALTFLQVAESSNSPETRTRNFGKALRGYTTVLHFLPRVIPTDEELSDMRNKLEEIKVRLLSAGFSADG